MSLTWAEEPLSSRAVDPGISGFAKSRGSDSSAATSSSEALLDINMFESTTMTSESSSSTSRTLMESLHQTLLELSQNPYPHIENPQTCKKRASVALVIRIRPNYHHWPGTEREEVQNDVSSAERLEKLFAEDWIKQGDPEVVFIKRAARQGDRWTSHVALPGGKRDPEDADDKAVAVRETFEEIGLDLNSPDALFVGNLPQRVVSTSWGKVPIMVLCPFVFLWTKPEMPALKLQPTEVASTHWVPLRVLLSPSVRTYEYVDVSDRFARQGGPLVKAVVRSVLGKMRFSAVRLIPSESLYCSSTAEFFSPLEPATAEEVQAPLGNRIYKWYLGDHAGSADRTRPLLLWGLTLGMLADFLDQLPPHNAVKLWSYPTFTSLDVRFLIKILTISLKRRNQTRLENLGIQNTAVDSETQAIASSDNPWFIGGMSDGIEASTKGKNAGKAYAVGVMLEGYYDLARRGVWIAAALRLFTSSAMLFWIVRRYLRR